MLFYYPNGEIVCNGDMVQYAQGLGIVEFIIQPETIVAENFCAPQGGVMLLLFSGGRILFDTTDNEEDLILIHRFDLSVVSRLKELGMVCSMRYVDGNEISPGDEIELSSGTSQAFQSHVLDVFPPFSEKAWERCIPTGGFTIEGKSGGEWLYAHADASIRRIS